MKPLLISRRLRNPEPLKAAKLPKRANEATLCFRVFCDCGSGANKREEPGFSGPCLSQRTSAADLKFLHRLPQVHRRNFKSKSGTGNIELLGACPNSRCSILSESDSSLGYEQVFSPLEYRPDTAAAAECAGLRAERPRLAVYR